MKKPDSLRAALTDALPELAREPDALAIYVTKGTLAARHGVNLGFEYRYTAQLVLLDYRGDPAQIFLPLMLWLRTYQRELILAHDSGVDAIAFDVDPVDNGAVDVQISVPLTEAVDVLPDGAGGYHITIREEPPVPHDEALTDPLALLRQIRAPGGGADELLVGYPDD